MGGTERGYAGIASRLYLCPTFRGELAIDIFGDTVETVLAPEPGVFVRATTLSTVSTGERVATLGLI